MKRAILSTVCIIWWLAGMCQPFVHPGMLHTQPELDFIREKVLSDEEPWASAWRQLKAADVAQLLYKATPFHVVSNGPYNKPNIGGSEFVKDGTAAYTMALQWYVERDKAYAEKAIEIMNDWACTLDSVVNHNRQLKVGTGGVKYLNAAEILKHSYPDWKDEDRKKFEDMVMEKLYPVIKDWTPRYNGNWDAANGQTLMCIGIFMDRRDIFDAACRMMLDGDSNGAIKNYYRPNGQCQESGRDQHHVQMGLGFMGCVAEIAWHQGVDLYGAFDNRLYNAFEYTARYMNGEEVPYEKYVTWYGRPVFGDTIAEGFRDRPMPVWERVYRHYHGRKGMEMPYTRKMIEKTRPEKGDPHSFTPWSTLTCVDETD